VEVAEESWVGGFSDGRTAWSFARISNDVREELFPQTWVVFVLLFLLEGIFQNYTF
jgi:hypothetical protein